MGRRRIGARRAECAVSNRISSHNPTGAGNYGRESSHVTACVNSRNPAGHNPGCKCGWKQREYASQSAPYMHPLDDCTDDCWECVKQAQWWQTEAMFKAEERAR